MFSFCLFGFFPGQCRLGFSWSRRTSCRDEWGVAKFYFLQLSKYKKSNTENIF